jgi:rhomboid protease GlpG
MMIKAASLPIEVNLLNFSRLLHSQGINHRINEESGQQVIWVENEQLALLVRDTLSDWSAGDAARLQATNVNSQSLINPAGLIVKLLQAFLRAPVSSSLILMCLAVAAVSLLGTQTQRMSMLFYPVLDNSGLFPLLASIDGPVEILRSLSPMLLHFGELHLVFNMLWLWYFGRQLESAQPRILFIALILFCSFVGNTAQYLYSGFNNFGGMSGVVYGLVGYTWVVHAFMPRSTLLINNSMFLVFVVALVAMEVVASSWIASAAHLGGLVAGLLLGVLAIIMYRFILGREAINKAGR